MTKIANLLKKNKMRNYDPKLAKVEQENKKQIKTLKYFTLKMKNYKEKEEKENQKLSNNPNKTILECQTIPKFLVKPPKTFFLKGMIFLDLNQKRCSRISNVNFYRQVSSSIILKELGIVYQNVYTNNSYFDTPQHVMSYLKRASNKQLNEIADKLEGFEVEQTNNERVKQQIEQLVHSNPLVQSLVAQKRAEFELFRRNKISSIPKDSYVKFIDIAYDFNDMTMKEIGNGLNEGFGRLLGCNLESLQAISIRQGIINFIEENSSWNLINKFINLRMSSFQEDSHFKGNLDVVTLDEIVLSVEFTLDIYLCKSGQIFKGFFHEQYSKYTYDKGIIFIELKPTEFQVQQINQMRQSKIDGKQKYQYCLDSDYYQPLLLSTAQKQQIPNNLLSQMEQHKKNEINYIKPEVNRIVDTLINDIPYVVQSQDFLEKFYGTQVIEQIEQNGIEEEDEQNLASKICGVKLR